MDCVFWCFFKANLEIQQHLQDKETNDITHSDVLGIISYTIIYLLFFIILFMHRVQPKKSITDK